MGGWLDWNALQGLLHLAVALLMFLVGWREHRQKDRDSRVWPGVWFTFGGVLMVIVIGQFTRLGDRAADLGRDEARSGNWYSDRRWVQTSVAVFLAVLLLTAVILAVWKVPKRLRRYLPVVITLLVLVCFVCARLLSLHQLDHTFFMRHVAGLELGDTAETVLLAVIVFLTVRALRMASVPRSVRPST